MALSLITPPTIEPLSLAQAKTHLIVDHDDDNALIQQLIAAVRQRCEMQTLRQLHAATWELTPDAFPCSDRFELRPAPLRAVTSVKYYDSAGTLQTWSASNYLVAAPYGPRAMRGSLFLPVGTSWPATAARREAVQIRFTAGYHDPVAPVAGQSVPPLLIAAMLMDLGTLYEQRQAVAAGTFAEMPMGARDIYRSFVSR